MTTLRSKLVMACAIAGVTALSWTIAQAHDHAPPSQSPQSATQSKRACELVRIVRQATARYRDVAAAEADGYQLHFGCVSGGEYGAMGLHYVNMNVVADGKLDATQPEIVIYEPLPNGRRKLIGADYLVLADDWHAKNVGAPELNGQLMHLITSPNRYGLPAFYTLHVWAWKHNPNGAFVNWHPHVSCEDFEG